MSKCNYLTPCIQDERWVLFHLMDRTSRGRGDARVRCAHEKSKERSKAQCEAAALLPLPAVVRAASKMSRSRAQRPSSAGQEQPVLQCHTKNPACTTIHHWGFSDCLWKRLPHSQISNKNHHQCKLAARAHVFINQDVNHGITKSSARQINILKTSRTSKLSSFYDCFFHDSLSNWVQQQASLW